MGTAMGCSTPQRHCLPLSTHPPGQHRASAPTASSLTGWKPGWLAPSKRWGFPSFLHGRSRVGAGPGPGQAAGSCKAVLQLYGHGSPVQSRQQDLTAQPESASRCRLFPGSQDFRPLEHAVSAITELLLSWAEVTEHTSFLACSNQHRPSTSSAPYPQQWLPKASFKLRDQGEKKPRNQLLGSQAWMLKQSQCWGIVTCPKYCTSYFLKA